MKMLLLFISCCVLFSSVVGQRNYDEAIQQGDDAFNKQQYKTAINKYFAAEAFDPTKKDGVKAKVNRAFDAIEALRKKAEAAFSEAKKQKDIAVNAQGEAESQRNTAEGERQKALNSAIEAESQRKLAETAKVDAESQRQAAETAKVEAEGQRKLAEAAKVEAESQKLIAVNALADANKQKEKAEENYTKFKELKETSIGSKYQGGVVVYWDDNTGQHGMIAAENDIVENGTELFTWDIAKQKCASLNLNGYADWRLPNRWELSVLYATRNLVGGFKQGDYGYWSSMEEDANNAWGQSFHGDGFPGISSKMSWPSRVRAVRSFTKGASGATVIPEPNTKNNQINTGQKQNNWRFCNKCSNLFYGPMSAACAAGGSHYYTNASSYNYMLCYGNADCAGQPDWFFCNKCSCIYYGGNEGSCATGGKHYHDNSTSYNYKIDYLAKSDANHQGGWHYCGKCSCLYFGSINGPCAAGGRHDNSASGNYVVEH